jgi:hypothetical protein
MMFLVDAWSALSSLIFPSPTMSVPSPLPLILSSHRSWDTEAFLSILWDQAKKTDDPIDTLSRYRVTSLEFRKTQQTSAEHEYLALHVEAPNEPQGLQFVLERTALLNAGSDSPDNATIHDFFKHRDSRKLLDTVLTTIDSTSSQKSVAATAALAAVPTLGTAASILPIALAASSSSFNSTSLLPMTSMAGISPEYNLVDQASMTMASILQAASDTQVGAYISKSLKTSKPPKDSRAEDRFVGGDMLLQNEYNLEQGTQMGEFIPKSLTLFHLALLAHIVHAEYPLYSLFMSQCYWYSSTVFYAAQIIDRNLPDHNILLANNLAVASESDLETDDIFLPFHLYVPPQAGRWKGIRISGCKRVVLETIVRKFYEQYEGYCTEVFLYFFQD